MIPIPIEQDPKVKAFHSKRQNSTIFHAILLTGVFSSVVNIFSLAAPLFMLEVYDRVIPSRSESTLAALTALLGGIFLFSGFLDLIRSRIMGRIAGLIDDDLSERVIGVIANATSRLPAQGDALKPAQDADQVRAFLSSPALSALFDLPWLPVFLATCFILHPAIGSLAALALAILLALSIIAMMRSRKLARLASDAIATRNRFGEAAYRNAESIKAMGLLPQVRLRWIEAHRHQAGVQLKLTDATGLFSGSFRTTRQMVQSGSLALGAWLVLEGQMTAGSIVAASIIVARTLQPLELLIAHWRPFVSALQSWRRLNDQFKSLPEEKRKVALPEPARSLRVERLSASPPGQADRPTVSNVTFQAAAGTAIGIVGPSASGKSSLARALSGVWPARIGDIRLDGAPLDQWPMEMLNRHIGYMAQSSDLLPGTIGENIARLDRSAPDTAIIRAARAAGVHDMITSLPDGYQTPVQEGGANLSAGQRQRIALARALYGDPFLVILDEPNSNLDRAGDDALVDAIIGVKARAGIVIVVTHRDSILSQLDALLVMHNGTATAFGPRELVLQSIRSGGGPTARLQPAPLRRGPALCEHG